MISNDLKEIIEQLKNQGKMCFIDAASDEQIDAFEKEKEIQLPKQYKEWLSFSDGGECFLPGGVQFYGVAHKPIIDVNDDDRPDEDYVVIGALASGDPIIFKKTEQRISIYNHEAGRIEDDESFSDFFCFLKELYAFLGIGG